MPTPPAGAGRARAPLLLAPRLAVAADQRVGRAVVVKLRLGVRLQLWDDRFGERLAQLHPPLVEGVDPPNGALGEDAVLVEGDERPQRLRGQALGEDRVGGAVAL